MLLVFLRFCIVRTFVNDRHDECMVRGADQACYTASRTKRKDHTGGTSLSLKVWRMYIFLVVDVLLLCSVRACVRAHARACVPGDRCVQEDVRREIVSRMLCMLHVGVIKFNTQCPNPTSRQWKATARSATLCARVTTH